MTLRMTLKQANAFEQFREDYRIQDHALQMIYTEHGKWYDGPYAPLNDLERFKLAQAIVTDHYVVCPTFLEQLERMIADQSKKVDHLIYQIETNTSTLVGGLSDDIQSSLEANWNIAEAKLSVLKEVYRMYVAEQGASMDEMEVALRTLCGEPADDEEEDDE